MQFSAEIRARIRHHQRLSLAHRVRETLPVRAAQGFGPSAEQKQKSLAKREPNTKASKTRSSKQVVQDLVQKGAKPSRNSVAWSANKARPVDQSQASKGKLDYVKVKDWGSGEPSDLGGLEVESFSPDIFSDHSKPFYEQLARRLEELQARGLLNIVQPQQAKPLPPFEQWSFTEKRYIQYMCDQHNVHHTLEAAIAEAVAVGPSGPHAPHEVQPSDACVAAFKAAACFGESCGLDRSLQIASDLDSLAKASSISNRSVEIEPTQQAVACCEYIARLGDIAGEEQEESLREEAALRLVTMAYGLHVAHLTTGMRIGSAAAEKQNLFAARALNFYRTYPDIQDPLKEFISIVNTAGGLLTAEQQEQLMDELPRAFPKISLLLTTLAHTN